MKNNLGDQNFINNLESYTGKPLTRKEDIEKLIGIIKEKRKEEEFEELIFTSKYICGLMRIVKNAHVVPEVNSFEHIKKDLNENIKKGIEQLRGIISFSGRERKSDFEKTYFSLTTESFNNLHQLFSDLEAVKKYINYLKRLP